MFLCCFALVLSLKWPKILFCIFGCVSGGPGLPRSPLSSKSEGRFLFCRPGDFKGGDRRRPGRLACFGSCRFDSPLSWNSIRVSKFDLDQKLQPKQNFVLYTMAARTVWEKNILHTVVRTIWTTGSRMVMEQFHWRCQFRLSQLHNCFPIVSNWIPFGFNSDSRLALNRLAFNFPLRNQRQIGWPKKI